MNKCEYIDFQFDFLYFYSYKLSNYDKDKHKKAVYNKYFRRVN